MARIVAVNQSEQKGDKKKNITSGILRKGHGLVGDAHCDNNSHRQVSLLAQESINKMQRLGLKVGPGDFAENLTTEGLDLLSLPIGRRIIIGKEVVLEVSQIGKECETPCAIYYQAGECIMPKEGIFALVIKGGKVSVGDAINISPLDSDERGQSGRTR
jgi:MOSC domain-containing protein YiiM